MAGFPRPVDDLSDVFYNGFKFPPALRSSIESKTVYDDSERQVLYVTHTIRIEFMLHAGVDAQHAQSGVYTPIFPEGTTTRGAMSDASLKTFRERVTMPGGHLVVNSIGFGGLRTDPTFQTNQDVRFGPKPRLISWKDEAGGRAVRVTWECEVSVPELLCAERTRNPIMVHNATQNWQITNRGITTRETVGYFIVRSNTVRPHTEITTRNNVQTGERQDKGTSRTTPRAQQIAVQLVSDEYRDIVKWPPLEGYHREHTFQMSPDKTRIDYRIVDTQIDSQNPYYPNVLEMSARQRTHANMSFGKKEADYSAWTVTISGDVRVLQGTSFYWAWAAFSEIVRSRLDIIVANARVSTDNKTFDPQTPVDGAKKPLVLMQSFSFDENLFQPSMSFSVSFLVRCDPNLIFRAAGVGKPVYEENITWRRWLDSISDAHDIRGISGLMFDKNNDVLTGLCDPIYSASEDIVSPREDNEERVPPYPPRANVDEENSWMYWRGEVDYIEDTQKIPHYLLEPSNTPLTDPTGDETPNSFGEQQTYSYSRQTSLNPGTPPVVQSRTTPKYLVLFKGVAERYGFDIAKPVLLTVGGVPAWPVGKLHFQKSSRRDVVNNARITIGKWVQLYQLATRPRGETTAPGPDALNYP